MHSRPEGQGGRRVWPEGGGTTPRSCQESREKSGAGAARRAEGGAARPQALWKDGAATMDDTLERQSQRR